MPPPIPPETEQERKTRLFMEEKLVVWLSSGLFAAFDNPIKYFLIATPNYLKKELFKTIYPKALTICRDHVKSKQPEEAISQFFNAFDHLMLPVNLKYSLLIEFRNRIAENYSELERFFNKNILDKAKEKLNSVLNAMEQSRELLLGTQIFKFYFQNQDKIPLVRYELGLAQSLAAWQLSPLDESRALTVMNHRHLVPGLKSFLLQQTHFKEIKKQILRVANASWPSDNDIEDLLAFVEILRKSQHGTQDYLGDNMVASLVPVFLLIKDPAKYRSLDRQAKFRSAEKIVFDFKGEPVYTLTALEYDQYKNAKIIGFSHLIRRINDLIKYARVSTKILPYQIALFKRLLGMLKPALENLNQTFKIEENKLGKAYSPYVKVKESVHSSVDFLIAMLTSIFNNLKNFKKNDLSVLNDFFEKWASFYQEFYPNDPTEQSLLPELEAAIPPPAKSKSGIKLESNLESSNPVSVRSSKPVITDLKKMMGSDYQSFTKDLQARWGDEYWMKLENEEENDRLLKESEKAQEENEQNLSLLTKVKNIFSISEEKELRAIEEGIDYLVNSKEILDFDPMRERNYNVFRVPLPPKQPIKNDKKAADDTQSLVLEEKIKPELSVSKPETKPEPSTPKPEVKSKLSTPKPETKPKPPVLAKPKPQNKNSTNQSGPPLPTLTNELKDNPLFKKKGAAPFGGQQNNPSGSPI